MLKIRSRSASKGKNKRSKYIPSAIIPSIAFVANPTAPLKRQSIDESRQEIFALNSSLLSHSQEQVYKKPLYYEDEDQNNNSAINEITTQNIPKTSKVKKHRVKSPKKEVKITDNVQEDKIEMERGSISLLANPQNLSVSFDEIDATNNEESKFPSARLGLNGNVLLNLDSFRSNMSEEKSVNNVDQFPMMSNEIYQKSDQSRNLPYPEASNGIYLKSDQSRNMPYPEISNGIHLKSDQSRHLPYPEASNGIQLKSNQSEYPVASYENQQLKINQAQLTTDYKFSSIQTQSSLDCPPPPIGFTDFNIQKPSYNQYAEGVTHHEKPEELSSRAQRDEVQLLRDTIYRLNIELNNTQLADSANLGDSIGQPIGPSVLPGRGPVPPWIMNTKYLVPLLLAHDAKFRQQNNLIDSLKKEIVQFEGEIKNILKENERLHLRFQETKNVHSSPDQREWHIIANQAKLVIEENRLLLEELDVYQKRSQLTDKQHLNEVNQLKKSISELTQERQSLDNEVQNLTRRLAEIRSNNNADMQFQHLNKGSEESSIKRRMLDDDFNESERMNAKLERELSLANQRIQNLTDQLEQQKLELKSENDFKFYFNQVIDKSNAIAEDREMLKTKIDKIDKDLSKKVKNIISDIKYRTNLELSENEKKADKKSVNTIQDNFHLLEEWIELILDSFEDLSKRCKHQERDVFYYQNVIKEKDKYLQESMSENKELENRLDYLLRDAANSN